MTMSLDIMDGSPLCNKCGACLSVCPVYQVTGLEAHSPRGKLSIIEAHRKGLLASSVRFEELVSYCLLCGACSKACAAQVDVDGSIQKARTALVKEKGLPSGKRFFFHYLLGSELLLPLVLKGGSLLQGLFFKTIPEDSGLHWRFPISLLTERPWLPALAEGFFLEECSRPEIDVSSKAAYFTGCVTNYLYPQVGGAVLSIFDFLGEPLSVPRRQKCCGFAAFSAGDEDTARSLARANISIFMDGHFESIVTACASCSFHLKVNYPKLLADDPVWAEKAVAFSTKIIDISDFLCHKTDFSRRLSACRLPDGVLKATHHDPCHFRFGQKLIEEPRLLIRSLPGLDFCEFDGGPACCGHGGLFNITHYQSSQRILDRRLGALQEMDTDILTTTCMGCLLQWKEGLLRSGVGTRAMHLVELFDLWLRDKRNEFC